ncbi:hypothetical protein HII31_05776 [Pseudocercospora fuligena]|uniref:Uncharacterized protein n=1 Tax=Pseudocercospora fuligena TaxID=685502 RepID=A0A8H6RLL0_9PEZI|nr:hypothetical protein HII31_05776 [Pseudocercospora fuligena]
MKSDAGKSQQGGGTAGSTEQRLHMHGLSHMPHRTDSLPFVYVAPFLTSTLALLCQVLYTLRRGRRLEDIAKAPPDKMTDQTRKQRLMELLSSNKDQISQLQNQIKNVEDRLASTGYLDAQLRLLRNSQMCAAKRFQSENKRLEFALADLDYFPFLDLPRELRDLVFQHCLVVGNLGLGPILPRGREPHPSANKPEWQLLQVNKQIREEAAKVLLGENSVILNTIDWDTMSDHFEKISCVSLDKLLHHFLTRVNIAFEVRNINQLSLDALDIARSFRTYQEEDLYEDAEERLAIHYLSSEDYQHWASMVKAIHSKNLKEVRIDVTNCYCVFGCHRLVREAWHAFQCLNLNAKLENIVVLGTKSEDERYSIKADIVSSLLESDEDWVSHRYIYPDGCENELGKFKDNIRPKLHFPKFEVLETEDVSFDYYDVEDGLEDEEVDLYDLAMEMKEERAKIVAVEVTNEED